MECKEDKICIKIKLPDYVDLLFIKGEYPCSLEIDAKVFKGKKYDSYCSQMV